MAATFSVGGLASGMDTNSIIDQLVALESQPITNIKTQQSNINVQISALADLISSVKALDTAAADLGTNGIYAAKPTSTNTAFSATPGTGAAPGRYSVEVNQLATAARWRSSAFTSGQALAAGKLTLTVQGQQYPPADSATGPISILATDTLTDVAYKIRTSGAPVSAIALTDADGNSYLSLASLTTGRPLDGGDDLALSFTPDAGATGTSVYDAATSPAVTHGTNATVYVDGLRFVRASNTVADVIPGVTLNLSKQAPGAPEDLVIATDPDATQARLKKFVDAYNATMTLVQRQLNVTKDTDRTRTLSGDAAVRDLQTRLQKLIVSPVGDLQGVRTLADVGIKTERNGSLSIQTDVLNAALARDPSAVNALFSTAGTGLAATVHAMMQAETQSVTGVLIADQDGLQKRVNDLDDETAKLQLRVDAFRANLVKQFTAMETTVSGLKNMGTFLTNAFAKSTST
jgi:flagellar hook-associated protein 2